MSIVEISNLTKIYNKKYKAIDDISLNIEKGKIYGLLGPNGAGKSTLINLIIGLLKPTEGKVTIFNQDSKDIKKFSKRLGYVPQNIAIYDNLTAYENVDFFAGIYGLTGENKKNKCREALEFVGLYEYRNTLSKRFSGGMQRRLNIACALLNDPELVIFDEPTVGIDPQSRNHILDSIIRLNKMGATVIYTSHYMEEVQKICDYIYIMDLGKVIARGDKEKLLTEYKLQISNYIVGINEDSYEEAKKVFNDKFIDGNIYLDNKNIQEIISMLQDNGIKFTEIKYNEADLEDLFLSLTGKKLRD